MCTVTVTGASLLLDECVIFLPLLSSPSLQMFTLLSIEPVASKCDPGEKQHAVTYLQQSLAEEIKLVMAEGFPRLKLKARSFGVTLQPSLD